jgi:arylsulfatase A-like enzyme
MRILYIDIDTLRPDHLGCYGYHRNTSTNIDKLAATGVRFENCYVSDSPCLPSRAAFYSGKCGIRNGAINHGGAAAEMIVDSNERKFRMFEDNYTQKLREAGYYTVSISPFGERHASFWFYNGFREMYNTGLGGHEDATEITPVALDWLDRKGSKDNWYLHLNLWDPHTPYRAPTEMGNPFENEPPPAWMNEEIRQRTWDTYGPGCAQEPGGSYLKLFPETERATSQIDSMASYKKWIDGYDCGIYHADQHIGLIVDKLEQLGVLDETMIIISSDHGENLGELAVYGDHQTADHITNRVPLIISHPKGLGGSGRVDKALYYQFDFAATILEMSGVAVPDSWDGKSFYQSFVKEQESGREELIVSNCAWACQRAVRWEDYIMVRSYHTGFKNYPEIMLFNIKDDPHEQHNLAESAPHLVNAAMAKLERWTHDELSRSSQAEDPMWTVIHEGGPFHANYNSPNFNAYKQRLCDTGRSQFAAELDSKNR